MYVDKLLEFGDAIAVALNIGNAIMPNSDVIDLGATPTLRDLGAGEPAYLVIQVDTTLDGDGGTIQLQLCSDSVAALTTSKTVHIDTGAIAETAWVQGYTKVYPLPLGITYERYLGIWMTVATANLTAGKINAFITQHPPVWYALPDSPAIV